MSKYSEIWDLHVCQISCSTSMEDAQTPFSYWQWTWVQRKGKKYCRWLTSVASLVHHQHIGANANYPTDIALELPVGQPDTAGRGEGLGFGARLWAVHLGPRGIDHAQVFRTLFLLHAIHVTGQPILLITASLNFNVTGWKRGQGGGPRFRIRYIEDGQFITVILILWHENNKWSFLTMHVNLLCFMDKPFFIFAWFDLLLFSLSYTIILNLVSFLSNQEFFFFSLSAFYFGEILWYTCVWFCFDLTCTSFVWMRHVLLIHYSWITWLLTHFIETLSNNLLLSN